MAAIISLPESPDSLVLGGEFEKEFVVYSDDANPSFEPVSGGQLCVTSSTTGSQWCGYDEPVVVPDVSDNDFQGGQICVTSSVTKISSCGYDVVTARDIVQGDRILVTFPDPRPPAPDMQNNIPVRMAIAGSPCGNFAVQIGCEQGMYCSGYGYASAGINPTVSYALLASSQAACQSWWPQCFESGMEGHCKLRLQCRGFQSDPDERRLVEHILSR